MSIQALRAARLIASLTLLAVLSPFEVIAPQVPSPRRKIIQRPFPPSDQRRMVTSRPARARALPLVADFDWSMEDRFGLDVNGNGRMDLPNTVGYVHNLAIGDTVAAGYRPTFAVTFNGSASRSNTGFVASHSWSVAGGRLTQPLTHVSVAPNWTVSLPEGTYTVTLTVSDGTNNPNTLTQIVPVEDFLIVSIGDSYSSGEGNPERRRGQSLSVPHYNPHGTGVLWADDGTRTGDTRVAQDHYRSHRTTVAWPAQVALALEKADRRTSVTFISLAASGATIAKGLMRAYPGVSNEPLSSTLPPMPAQLLELPQLVRSRRVDALFLSVGGNDAGFANVIQAFVRAERAMPGDYDSTVNAIISRSRSGNWPRDQLAGSDGLRSGYSQVAALIRRLNVFSTYLVGYGDPTGYLSGGQLHWCPSILDGLIPGLEIDVSEQEKLVQRILNPLNAQMRTGAREHGWSFVLQDDFANGHGICATAPYYANSPDAYDFYVGNTYPADLPRPSDPRLAWFRTLRQAEVAQGPLNTTVIRAGGILLPSGLDTAVNTKGVLHPNEFGHQAIRDQALRSLYLPVPVPGFFDDWDDVIAEATEARRQGNTSLRLMKRSNTGQMVQTPFYETIFPVSDVDMFRINATRNELIEVRATVFDTGHVATVRAFAPDGMELYRRTIGVSGPMPCGSCPVGFRSPAAGPVYIGVSGFSNALYDPVTGLGDENGGGSFSYELFLANVDGQPDNTIATATSTQPYGAVIGFAIETPRDVDMFRLDGNAGDTMRVTIGLPTGSGLAPRLRLFLADGTELAQDSSAVQHHFGVAGALYLGVSSSNTTYDPGVGVAVPDTSTVVGIVTRPSIAGRGVVAVPRVRVTSGGYTLNIARQ